MTNALPLFNALAPVAGATAVQPGSPVPGQATSEAPISADFAALLAIGLGQPDAGSGAAPTLPSTLPSTLPQAPADAAGGKLAGKTLPEALAGLPGPLDAALEIPVATAVVQPSAESTADGAATSRKVQGHKQGTAEPESAAAAEVAAKDGTDELLVRTAAIATPEPASVAVAGLPLVSPPIAPSTAPAAAPPPAGRAVAGQHRSDQDLPALPSPSSAATVVTVQAAGRVLALPVSTRNSSQRNQPGTLAMPSVEAGSAPVTLAPASPALAPAVAQPNEPRQPATAERLTNPASPMAADAPASQSLPEQSLQPGTIAPQPAPVTPAPASAGSATVAAPAHDFTALVDRLVEARATALAGQPVQMVQTTLASHDFGPVSLRFDLTGEALSVSLSSADPEFNRAVLAAAPAAPADSGTRGESGGQGASQGGQAQSGQPSHGQSSQRGTPSQPRSGRDEAGPANRTQDQHAPAERPRGLFA